MKLTKVMRIVDRIIDIGAILSAAIIVFALFAVNVEVFMRYFVGEVLTWVIDITAILLIFMTFLGGAWLLRKDGHVVMDIVVIRLNPKTQSLLNIINCTVVTILCAVMIWYGTKSTWFHYQMGIWIPTALETPKWIVLSIIPLGSFLLFIQALRKTYTLLKVRISSVTQEDKEHKAAI